MNGLAGKVSIVGFASLLSEKSARSTFPHLQNFRKAKVKNYRRVFAHVAPIFFERNIARRETKEISSCSAEYCEGEEILVSLFEINQNEMPNFYEREHEFLFADVEPFTLDDQPMGIKAIICAKWNDEEYKKERIKSDEDWHQRYGRWGVSKVYDDDVLPCRVYLRHCVLAAKNFGEEVYQSFLSHSYLSDRKTTIGEYLERRKSIMLETPPEALKERYSG
eukprot:TRINITY_DN3195_c0_g1_i1.p1 TRINITY_DN3195_c0_g1~~TRINITY_DN3195_c0_g1_i1.p1  ORF type:complete len:233 (-),score=62.22 TRINITY_DN3195_c0_g1_i1:174-836(-)